MIEDGKDYTERGFRVFGTRARPEGENLYGQTLGRVTVLESSLAGRGPHVRIYAPGDEQVHLNYDEAKLVRDALSVFITEAEAGQLTENIYGAGPKVDT